MVHSNLFQSFLCSVFVFQGLAIKNSSNSMNIQSTSTEHLPAAIEIRGNMNSFSKENSTEPLENSSTLVSAITSMKIQKEFKPSISFDGAAEPNVYQTRNSGSNRSPFNNVQHVHFESSVGLEGERGPVSFPNSQSTKEDVKSQIPDSQYEEYPHEVSVNYGIPLPPIKAVYYTPGISHYQIKPTINSYYEKPIKYDFESPINYYQHHEYATANRYNDHHQYNHHITPIQHQESTEIVGGKLPDILHMTSHRETSLTKTGKLPYKFYQPEDDTGIHFIEDGHAFVPRPRHQISSWRKLIHLVGAILPFGLLLAALNKPNIKIDRNSTLPSIMLSKWRGVDLPLEHKEKTGLEACKDMILCEAMVSGVEKDADFIYSLLWNLAVESSDEEVRKNGLAEVFRAVKKKNCKSITC